MKHPSDTYQAQKRREYQELIKQRAEEARKQDVLDNGSYWDILGTFGDEWNTRGKRSRL